MFKRKPKAFKMGQKNLIIVRHGKSSWDYSNVDDIDRPLKERGINDAHLMASRIKGEINDIDLILSSSADRALHTANIFARELKVPSFKIRILEDIYFADESELLQMVKSINNEINTVLLFGHNPTFTIFANYFVKSPLDNLPTSGVVLLSFDIEEWKDLDKSKVISRKVDYPKNK
jgi:phosphohistidine phosphatase